MLAHKTPVELSILQVEVFLGVFIGAVTFTGSVVAFGKLAGKIDGKPRKLAGGHMLNAGALALSVILLLMLSRRRRQLDAGGDDACSPSSSAGT